MVSSLAGVDTTAKFGEELQAWMEHGMAALFDGGVLQTLSFLGGFFVMSTKPIVASQITLYWVEILDRLMHFYVV